MVEGLFVDMENESEVAASLTESAPTSCIGPRLNSLNDHFPEGERIFREHRRKQQEYFEKHGKFKKAPLELVKSLVTKVLPRVFLDISCGGEPLGRIIIVLYRDLAPKAVENFRSFCTGEKGLGSSGKPLHYKGCHFTRIIPEFFCQAGDATIGNGMGGETIYGCPMEDEITPGRRLVRGDLVTATPGPHAATSQFCILFGDLPWMEGKATIIGHVENGFKTLSVLEKLGSQNGIPFAPVTVIHSGQMMLSRDLQSWVPVEPSNFPGVH